MEILLYVILGRLGYFERPRVKASGKAVIVTKSQSIYLLSSGDIKIMHFLRAVFVQLRSKGYSYITQFCEPTNCPVLYVIRVVRICINLLSLT